MGAAQALQIQRTCQAKGHEHLDLFDLFAPLLHQGKKRKTNYNSDGNKLMVFEFALERR